MRKRYIYPQVKTLFVEAETFMAISSTLEKGEGSGGNVAEIKDQIISDDESFDWNIWE